LAEFDKIPLIIRENNRYKGVIHEILRQVEHRGLKPNVVLRCDSFQLVKGAVRRKMGLGILHVDVVAPDIKSGEFKPIQISGMRLEHPSYIIHHKDRPLSAYAEKFVGLLRESAG